MSFGVSLHFQLQYLVDGFDNLGRMPVALEYLVDVPVIDEQSGSFLYLLGQPGVRFIQLNQPLLHGFAVFRSYALSLLSFFA